MTGINLSMLKFKCKSPLFNKTPHLILLKQKCRQNELFFRHIKLREIGYLTHQHTGNLICYFLIIFNGQSFMINNIDYGSN